MTVGKWLGDLLLLVSLTKGELSIVKRQRMGNQRISCSLDWGVVRQMSRRKSKTYRVWFPKNIIWTYLWLEDCDFFLVNCSFIHFQLVQVNKLKNWWKREEPIFSISALIFSTAHKNRMQSRITRHHEHANPLLPQHL